MCEKWERYHLIRDCIRQPGSKQLVTGLSVKLSAALDAEAMPGVSAWRNRAWLKPVSGLAIAASVAFVAIMVAAPQAGLAPADVDTALAAPANQPFVSPNTVGSPISQAASFAPAQQASSNPNRLNAYLLRHNQMARTAGRQGFVSFVPIVATATPSGPEDPKGQADLSEPRSELEAAEIK
jgi:sigma-E factor negative regulatory protein RseA